MIILKDIEIENYKNIKHSYLKDLKGLNILIGPNNCGKTNFLRAINLITKFSSAGHFGNNTTTPSSLIQHAWNINPETVRKSQTNGIQYSNAENESYLKNSLFKINYTFDSDYLSQIMKNINLDITLESFPEYVRDAIKQVFSNNKHYQQTAKIHMNELGLNNNHNPKTTPNELILKQTDKNNASMQYFSLFAIEKLTKNIKENIKFIEDNRLEKYKGVSIYDYIFESQHNPRKEDETILIDRFIRDIVDPSIVTRSLDVGKEKILLVDKRDFENSIENQGSGIRSIICLGWDIIQAKENSIILIDEPELGLNSFAKQELLKLLFKESKTKQIFITTQDPTFVNPILWNKKDVAVYLYSLVEEKFVKIDLLHKNKDDYNTFGGFLPHTTSLKDIHIYVEGPSDVYIFQILLTKYFKKYFKNKSLQMLNRTQIYTLGGDFWEHLLYTIPKPPYKCLVILDGDKQELCKEVCKKYEKSGVNTSKFEYYKNIESTKMSFNNEKRVWPINEQKKHSIICLKKDCIEKYFNPNFDCKNPPENYNKIIDGIKKAEEMKEIPEELKKIFDYTFCVTDKNIK